MGVHFSDIKWHFITISFDATTNNVNISIDEEIHTLTITNLNRNLYYLTLGGFGKTYSSITNKFYGLVTGIIIKNEFSNIDNIASLYFRITNNIFNVLNNKEELDCSSAIIKKENSYSNYLYFPLMNDIHSNVGNYIEEYDKYSFIKFNIHSYFVCNGNKFVLNNIPNDNIGFVSIYVKQKIIINNNERVIYEISDKLLESQA